MPAYQFDGDTVRWHDPDMPWILCFAKDVVVRRKWPEMKDETRDPESNPVVELGQYPRYAVVVTVISL